MIEAVTTMLSNPWVSGSCWLTFSVIGWSFVYVTGSEMRVYVDLVVRRGIDGQQVLDRARWYLRIAHIWLYTGVGFFVLLIATLLGFW